MSQSHSPATAKWYVEHRATTTTDQASLDLSRHIPRRAAAGTVVVIADDPAILLSVIRKRWTGIVREIERQRSSTLDSIKRRELGRELERMQNFCFTSKSPARVPGADAYFMALHHIPGQLPPDYFTLYVTVPITAEQLGLALNALPQGGLVVFYGEMRAEYREVLGI